MLYWAAVFFVIALLAAVFGFGGIAASAAGVAKILFFVFLVLAVVSGVAFRPDLGECGGFRRASRRGHNATAASARSRPAWVAQ